MFEFLFKYPASIFSKGEFVLLGAWPKWFLALLVLTTAAGLALLIRKRRQQASARLNDKRAAIVWFFQFSVATVVLILLWQPAITVAELKPQQNIIAVIVDDSRSMAIADEGMTREAKAAGALEHGTLAELQKKFQTRLYRLDSRLIRIDDLKGLQTPSTGPATRINDSLKQLVSETADLPVGAVVLLSDGSDNSGGIERATISAFRSRHIPIHTIGFGLERVPNDVEIKDAVVSPRALTDSRLSMQVSFRERGFAGRSSTITVRDGEKVLASREITFASDEKIQTENLLFNAGSAGAKTLQISIAPLAGEQNTANNSLTRLLHVESAKRRILYVEGEPRWEYKFIRRAEDDDHNVQLVSMLRTTENKIYRQGIDDPKELADGFPARAEDLFAYQGIILGSVEANYFTLPQQELIREFVDRRGGGALFLGGRFALSDGGYASSNLADLLPLNLPIGKDTFHRDPATVALTQAGAESTITRLIDDPVKNVERWKMLPYLMDYQESGTPKPGAAVLAEMNAGSRRMPFLTTENYGRGRTAVVASGGVWRWQMSQPLGDTTHDMFWRQLLRWLVADSPGEVTAAISDQMLFDDGRIHLSAGVVNRSFQPAPDAHVEAHILGPGGISASVEMSPVPDTPGQFQADWNAGKPGSYVTEIIAQGAGQEVGRDVLTFQRMDGVAENFHTEQNRELLDKLATETGGRYWRPSEVSRLPEEIPYSDAGITMRENKELWNMPAVFLLLMLLRLSEWLLRRKWGVV
jgi:uncharacterized membrane protein